MSFIRRIFGLGEQRTSAPQAATKRSVGLAGMGIEGLSRPAVHLRPTNGPSRTKVGGRPLVDASFQWPEYDSQPLSFIAQIDLASISKCLDSWPLPDFGLLLFFYHSEQGTWGFDPKDRGSWRVILVDGPEEDWNELAPAQPGDTTEYPRLDLEGRLIRSLPDGSDARFDDLDNDEHDRYVGSRDEVYEDLPMHQLFGYAAPQQSNEMALECQLASNGLYCGDASGYQDPRAQELRGGADDWRPLLQVDTDDGAEMMWGDVGMLYFWIRQQDLDAGNFEDVWMILQCS